MPENFEIDEKGQLKVKKELDRETKDTYALNIGAKNKNGDIIEDQTLVYTENKFIKIIYII